jgi:hypothetical protein
MQRDTQHTLRVASGFLALALSALFAGCGLLDRSPCPVHDKSYCEFVRELEPLIASLDSDAILDRTAMVCCKGDYAWPDEAGSPGFDPSQPCVRAGVFLGEGACLTADQFSATLVRLAPLSIDHLVHTAENLPGLHVEGDELAILVSTGDPDWFLTLFTLSDSGTRKISAVIQVRRAVLERFPAESFIAWPPGQGTPKPPPQPTVRG